LGEHHLDADRNVHQLRGNELAVLGALDVRKLDENPEVPPKVRHVHVVALVADLDDLRHDLVAITGGKNERKRKRE
jgi:hypothetical protein